MQPLENLGPTMRYILERAIMAPSGDNLQPWHFVIKKDSLELWNVPSKDPTPHDWNERASHIACGTALENIVLAASSCNLEAQVSYFPDDQAQNHVATIHFLSRPALIHPLSHFIDKRCSNRKPYETTSLTAAEVDALCNQETYTRLGIRVALTTERTLIKNIARVAALYERFIFSNKILHSSFFGHLSSDHILAEQKGLYIPTLELSLIERISLPLLSNWRIASLMNLLGLDSYINFNGARRYARSGGIGALFVSNLSREQFVHAGQALERLWLVATSLGLEFQILSGASLIRLQEDDLYSIGLQPSQRKLLEKSFEQVEALLNVEGHTILTLFRTGHGPKPSSRSKRLPLECFVTVAN